jgi:hypothetical protein
VHRQHFEVLGKLGVVLQQHHGLHFYFCLGSSSGRLQGGGGGDRSLQLFLQARHFFAQQQHHFCRRRFRFLGRIASCAAAAAPAATGLLEQRREVRERQVRSDEGRFEQGRFARGGGGVGREGVLGDRPLAFVDPQGRLEPLDFGGQV